LFNKFSFIYTIPVKYGKSYDFITALWRYTAIPHVLHLMTMTTCSRMNLWS